MAGFHIDQLADLLIFRTNVAGIFRLPHPEQFVYNYRFDAMFQDVNNLRRFAAVPCFGLRHLSIDDLYGVTIDSVFSGARKTNQDSRLVVT